MPCKSTIWGYPPTYILRDHVMLVFLKIPQECFTVDDTKRGRHLGNRVVITAVQGTVEKGTNQVSEAIPMQG